MYPAIEKLVQLAKEEVGVKESSSISQYQKATRLKPGPFSYSASFLCWLLREWTKNPEVQSLLKLTTASKIKSFLCRDARAYEWETWAQKHQIKILPQTELAKAGDFVLFEFNHIGVITEDQLPGSKTIEDIEADIDNGVWQKTRDVSLVKCYIRIL